MRRPSLRRPLSAHVLDRDIHHRVGGAVYIQLQPVVRFDRLYGRPGEITSETRAIPIQGCQVPAYTTTFTYDTWNRLQQMVYPDQPTGETVKYTYDFGGLPYRVRGNDDQLDVDSAAPTASASRTARSIRRPD
jgi:hypothetical protein